MVVRTDSDAARSMLHRAVCGRARHLATRYLWHQDKLKNGLFEAVRCASKYNPADVGTKALDSEEHGSDCWECSALQAEPQQALRRPKGRERWQRFCSGQVLCPKRESAIAGQCWRKAMRSMVWVCCGR